MIPPHDLNPTVDQAAEMVSRLAKDFESNSGYYLSPSYQEAEVRKDFIDKFLFALGWDVNHDIQRNPFEQEVKVERSVQMATAQRRADYSLSIAPNFDSPVLYIEAKKPHADIATADNYFQTIRYANQRAHPVGLLTDFEQLHVIDCRYQANIDTALNHGVRRFHYFDYVDPAQFSELFFLFSRPAIYEGSIAKYAETLPAPKHGRPGQKTFFSLAFKPPDERLLETLDGLRESLARALKNKNPQLDSDALTELTQRILDRLVFIRFLEDKLIEPDPIIPKMGEADRSAWEDFLRESRRLNAIYNGIVFKHHPVLDDFDALTIDNKAFCDVLNAFDFHNSTYLFADIPLYILGSIYERFLGNVIVATEKRATLEPKPEVRKAGGVYYTPKYVVDYIVENTVGKLIDGRSPADIAKMRFADIACGSGSFLLGVYSYLLKYITGWYNENPTKAPKAAVISRDGALYLSLSEKARILTDNIYGVDIDSQAVEVAQLSLYLKLLEEETTASARQYALDFHRPLLPSLADNIKCGNSLISQDFYKGDQLSLLDAGDTRKVNAFDWPVEFADIMKSGGFDVIVGNPPYAYRNATEDAARPYYLKQYQSAQGNFDIYKFFLERATGLLKQDGRLGMIVSATFLVLPTHEKLRQLLLKHLAITSLAPLGPKVFRSATVDTAIIIARKAQPAADHEVSIYAPRVPTDLPNEPAYQVRQSRFSENDKSAFDYKLNDRAAALSARLFASFPNIETGFEFGVGINTGYIRDELVSDQRRNKRDHPMVPGTGISRYGPVVTKGWIMYDREYVRAQGKRGRTLPAEHLLSDQKILVVRTRNLSLARRVVATYDKTAAYNLNRLSNIVARPGNSLCGLLGILNSSLFNWLFSTKFFDYEIKPVYLRQCPLADVNDKKLIGLVDVMLALHRKLRDARTDHDRTLLQRQVESTDRRIDDRVFELYGLTDAEIEIAKRASRWRKFQPTRVIRAAKFTTPSPASARRHSSRSSRARRAASADCSGRCSISSSTSAMSSLPTTTGGQTWNRP